MPRPAAKRKRVPQVVIPVKETAKPYNTSKNDVRDLENGSPKLPGKKTSASHYARDAEQQAKNQTPTTRRRDRTVERTPAGERLASGSRPPTRSRGYSSTLSLGGRKGDANPNIPRTPAFENSVLSNFRRRPRQPSILHMMHDEDRGSDPDDEDFLGGLSPEDESTPLNLARQKSLQARQDVPSDTESLSSSSTVGSRKRKRTPEEFQVAGSPTEIVENTQLNSSPPDYYGASASYLPPPDHVGILSQTMAVPESSSPALTPAHAARGFGSGHLASDTPDITKEAYGSAVPLSTEALQGKVLPRRRLRQRRNRSISDFGVPSDEDEYDEPDDDELSRMPTKASKSRRKQIHRSKPLTERGLMPKPTYQKQNKNRAKTTELGPTAKGRSRRTFGKENRVDNMPSESGAETDAPGYFVSEELEAQARKFAEIDKWEMEFEDVAISGSQASSAAI